MFQRMRRWFRAVGNGGRLDDQMDQELAIHLELGWKKLVRVEDDGEGMDPEDARLAL